MVKTSILVAVFVVALVVVGVGAFLAGQYTAAPQLQVYKPPEKIKAAWIYVGPVGDAGWSYMHDIGRRYVAELFKEWLETTYVEAVSEAELLEVVDRLVAEGYNVIFTTSFEFMDKTIEAGKKYPNVMFFHCSGYKRAPNVGTYFADLYQVYYLNGLMAGALTETGQLGYVAAYLIPEVVRHINAFAIGAREVGEQLGKNITVHVIEIMGWYAPDKAEAAADTLVKSYGVDVLAFTEDSTRIVEYANRVKVYVFSHYGPMMKYGPEYTVSGQLVRWEVIYADILVKVKAGVLRPDNLDKVDYWYLLSSGAVDLAADIDSTGAPVIVNPRYVSVLKGISVRDKLTGEELSVYDLVMRRYRQMKEAFMVLPLQFSADTHKYENIASITINWGGMLGTLPYPIAPIHDPFIGPLSGYCLYSPDKSYSKYCISPAPGGRVSIPAGLRLSHEDLWTMDYFLDYVVKH
ncbi:MAG: BMP family ABC transporter substrate-binding protein [Desulfurococcaceae archaeon]